METKNVGFWEARKIKKEKTKAWMQEHKYCKFCVDMRERFMLHAVIFLGGMAVILAWQNIHEVVILAITPLAVWYLVVFLRMIYNKENREHMKTHPDWK
jgi:hypothetical protein